MKSARYIQVLLAYQQARKGKLTDTTLIALLGVRRDFLTQLIEGKVNGGDIKIGNLARTVNHFLHEEQKNIELLEKCNKTDTRAYAETQECISMICINHQHGRVRSSA